MATLTRDVEAQYLQSAFIQEICVIGLRESGERGADRPRAVVVPNMDLIRRRRIVNIGDLLRFEIEGQAIHLPIHQRVLAYDVWFEPLPRTTTGELNRHEIERRLHQKQAEATHRAVAGAPDANAGGWGDDVHAQAAAAVIARRGKGLVLPNANLELDLAIDSMERVELIAELEHRFGVHVRGERAHEILTVSHLIEAVRPVASYSNPAAMGDAWALMLRDLPAPSDPALGRLLHRRPLAARVLFVLLRLLRALMPEIKVSGLEHLPIGRPFIISPNHQSYLDPFFVCSVLPFGTVSRLFFVGATEYFESPAAAWLARQFNLVPVDPDANLVPAMKAGAFGLRHGKVLLLFPEGERSIDGTVKRFKKGAVILSRHMHAPIVPVAIHGVYEVWPRNRAFKWTALMPWSRHRVHVAFGAPMQCDDAVGDADAASALRERVNALWTQLAADAGDSPQKRREQESRGDAAGKERT